MTSPLSTMIPRPGRASRPRTRRRATPGLGLARGPEALERRDLLTSYEVGPGLAYAKLSALPDLAPGDVVEVNPGTYNDAVLLTASGTPTRPITIRGVGAARPVIDGTGVNVSGALPHPRALIEVRGSNYVIEHLEIRDAHNSNLNGAGVRVLYADNTVVRDCLLHDNDMGLMTFGDSGTLIDACEIVHNGDPAEASHRAHNIYAESDSITIQYSYIHDAMDGQNVKSRSHYTALLYNYIADSNEGEVCLVDDLGMTTTAYSNALVVGNVIVSKADRTGNATKFIDFGQDTGYGHNGTLYLVNNTLVAGSPLITFLQTTATGAKIVATNNIFTGSDHLVGITRGAITGSNNGVPTTATVPSGFSATTRAEARGFVDPAGRDYDLSPASPFRDLGLASPTAVNGSGATISAVPQQEYVNDLSGKPRPADGSLDLGAYEAPPAGSLPLLVANPSDVVAGTPFSVTVTVRDPSGGAYAGYLGTVHFTSDDPRAVLPADYTFTAADAGVHTFTATLKTAGARSVTVADALTPSDYGVGTTTVSPAAAASFRVAGFPSTVTAGASRSFTVTALDAFGNVATGYLGSVDFTSTDPQAVLPADYTFTAADRGVHTFSATLKTADVQSVGAADTAAAIGGTQGNITVNPAAAVRLIVGGYVATTTAGASHTFTVTAQDAFGNVATGFTGTVRFTSNDPAAVLPASYKFTATNRGKRTFTATLKTAGTRSITATTTTSPTITGTQSGITVNPAAPSRLALSGFPSVTTSGVPHSLTVTVKDAFGNTVTGFTGFIHITSSDLLAILPADYAFSAADRGVHTFSVTLKSLGLRSITATTRASATVKGTLSGITVV